MQIEKAKESLQAAELCFNEKLYNSTANRAYYAMFQAAVVALERSGIRPQGSQWSHDGLQATFARELTNRRKIYARHLVRDLLDVQAMRNQADYLERDISKRDAQDALNLSREFVSRVIERISNV